MGYFNELMIERYNNFLTDSIAEHIGLDFYELAAQEFEVVPELNNDGIKVGYLIVFSDNTPPKFLAKVPGIANHTVAVPTNIVEASNPFDYEYDAISEERGLTDNFNQEIQNLKELNTLVLQNDALNKILKRQIYIALIGTMETFLSETFIKITLSNDSYFKRFVKSHPEFGNRKFLLKDVFETFENLKDASKDVMLDTIYHNLRNVREMYKSTFEIGFPDIRDALICVNIRHDLVHRNGKSKDGKIIEIDTKVIDQAIQTIGNLVQAVAKNILQLEEPPF